MKFLLAILRILFPAAEYSMQESCQLYKVLNINYLFFEKLNKYYICKLFLRFIDIWQFFRQNFRHQYLFMIYINKYLVVVHFIISILIISSGYVFRPPIPQSVFFPCRISPNRTRQPPLGHTDRNQHLNLGAYLGLRPTLALW